MNKIVTIPILALLISSCATKPTTQAYDYVNDPPVKLGQSVHYALNAPVLIMNGKLDFGIEYETDVEQFMPSNGAEINLRKFIIQTQNSHVHLKCENEGTALFLIDGERYIFDLRSDNSEFSDNVLTLWREQDFRDKVEEEERARGMALHELLNKEENQK